MAIQSVVFDLGRVLMDVDFAATLAAFRRLGAEGFDRQFSGPRQSALVDRLEVGAIAPAEFRAGLRLALRLSAEGAPDAALDEAWCAMLGAPRPTALATLAKLAAGLPCFVLSNTNAIHLDCLRRRHADARGQLPWERLVRRTYYSFEMGARKPRVEAFEAVLEGEGLVPEQTVFVDDLLANVEAARALGMRTVHLGADAELRAALSGLGLRL